MAIPENTLMNVTLSDDQLVLALIAAYKSRGVDMSAMLDDPIFSKMPASSKVRAIQAHAGELASGVNPGFGKTDYRRIGANTLLSAVPGVLAGASIGAAIGQGAAKGVGALHGGVVGALTTGAAGALAGYLSSKEESNRRAAIKSALEEAATSGSVANALKPLTVTHATGSQTTLRKNILDRISGMVGDASHRAIEPILQAQHSAMQLF